MVAAFSSLWLLAEQYVAQNAFTNDVISFQLHCNNKIKFTFCVCPPCLCFSEFHNLKLQYWITLAPFSQIFCNDFALKQTRLFIYYSTIASNLLSICYLISYAAAIL
jgi:hypothetical protein